MLPASQAAPRDATRVRPRGAGLDALLFGASPVVWLAGGLALYMAWTIGANDVANAMGTSVGSGALTLFRAVIVAGVLEFCGAFFVGGHVTDTVRKGILSSEFVSADASLVLYGMLGSLAAAATLLLIATRYGLPISTTHSIVGAIVGFGAVGLGLDAVIWSKVAQIVASWVTSPLIGGALAFVVFNITRYLILDRPQPMEEAKRFGPLFFFVVTFMIALVTLFKGLKNLKLDFDLPEALALATGVGLIGAAVGRFFLQRVRTDPEGGDRFRQVERVFVVLQVMTACAVAFAHGSNDVANAIGPLASIGAPGGVQGPVLGEQGARRALDAGLIGGLGIVFGLATWGYRGDGDGRQEGSPSSRPAAASRRELAAALTIVLASSASGIPVSTTHILVGSVLGVGHGARHRCAGSAGGRRRILMSWVATLADRRRTCRSSSSTSSRGCWRADLPLRGARRMAMIGKPVRAVADPPHADSTSHAALACARAVVPLFEDDGGRPARMRLPGLARRGSTELEHRRRCGEARDPQPPAQAPAHARGGAARPARDPGLPGFHRRRARRMWPSWPISAGWSMPEPMAETLHGRWCARVVAACEEADRDHRRARRAGRDGLRRAREVERGWRSMINELLSKTESETDELAEKVSRPADLRARRRARGRAPSSGTRSSAG